MQQLAEPGSPYKSASVLMIDHILSATQAVTFKQTSDSILGADTTVMVFETAEAANAYYDSQHVFEGSESMIRPVTSVGERAVETLEGNHCAAVRGNVYAKTATPGVSTGEHIATVRAVVDRD